MLARVFCLLLLAVLLLGSILAGFICYKYKYYKDNAHRIKPPSENIDFNPYRKINDCGSDKFRWDGKREKCFELGKSGGCGANMVFKEIDNMEGECRCDSSKSYVPLVFYIQQNRCYYIYEKAYCAEGQWLQMMNNEGHCERNKCYTDMRRKKSQGQKIGRMVFVGNNCVEIGSPCERGFIAFDPGDSKPKCMRRDLLDRLGIQIFQEGRRPSADKNKMCDLGYARNPNTEKCEQDRINDF